MKKLPKDIILGLANDPELLAHAKLYVFADRFNVQALKSLAWKKLERELDIILEATALEIKNDIGYYSSSEPNTTWHRWGIFDKAIAKDLTDLISYCCENLPCAGSKAEASDLLVSNGQDVWILDDVTSTSTRRARGGNRDGNVSMNPLPTHLNQPLLDYLVKFCAWQWDLLQKHETFTMFILDPNTDIEFRSVFFANLLPSNVPPNRTN